MRLDPDLVRSILLKVENAPANQMAGDVAVDGWSEDEVLEHIELLNEAGLLEAKIVRAGSGKSRIYAALVQRLTWSGHEFLNDARDNSRWNQAKKIAVEKAGSVSLDVLKAILGQLALSAFKINAM